MIEDELMVTKYSPCTGKKDNDPCFPQIGNYSEERNSTCNKSFVTAFQDFYGASGSIAKELKKLSSDEDPFIKSTVLELKEMINKQHHRSKFECFQENKISKIHTSHNIKDYICQDSGLLFPCFSPVLPEFPYLGFPVLVLSHHHHQLVHLCL